MKSDGDDHGNSQYDPRDALLYQLRPQNYQHPNDQHQHGKLHSRDFYLSNKNSSNQKLGNVLSQHHLSSSDN